jgi:hypothetical protein
MELEDEWEMGNGMEVLGWRWGSRFIGRARRSTMARAGKFSRGFGVSAADDDDDVSVRGKDGLDLDKDS